MEAIFAEALARHRVAACVVDVTLTLLHAVRAKRTGRTRILTARSVEASETLAPSRLDVTLALTRLAVAHVSTTRSPPTWVAP